MKLKTFHWEILLLALPLLFIGESFFALAVYISLGLAIGKSIIRRVLISALLKDMARMHTALKRLEELQDARFTSERDYRNAEPPST